MDHLRICMNALRWSASDAECVYLGEKWINKYRQAEAADQIVSLNRLLNALSEEAEQRPSEDIWITMQAYVLSLLAQLEPEEPLPPLEE
jgi:thiaminase